MKDEDQKHTEWWGVALITTGVLLLFHNFNLIRWDWYALRQTWPMLLVVWGVGALDMDVRAKRIIIISMIALIVWWIMGGFGMPGGMYRGRMRVPDAGVPLCWRL